ncbi:MAG TPA: TadE/TadG family type IV pilus assembly protein [Caulobacteraceae bacterium]|jgi:Flp pilus assembly protein TadG
MRSFLACRRGAAAVEAALVLPLLISVGLAAADAGWLFSETHRTKAGLAAGARYLAKARVPTAVEADAENIAVTGRRTGGTARVKGWTVAHVTVSYRTIDNSTQAYTGPATIRIVRLRSVRPYQGFGLLSLMGVGALNVAAVHEERWTGS